MSTILPCPGTTTQLIEELYGERAPVAAAQHAARQGQPEPRQCWRAAVQAVAEQAKTILPESHGRIDSAVKIVLAGDVDLLPDGQAQVASQSNGETSYHVVTRTCPCPDAAKAPEGWCKHRLSVAIFRRATAHEQTRLASLDTPPAPVVTPSIPAQYVVTIQGKAFVKFAGLLALAHARGLVELTATWTYNDAGLSLAEAVCSFKDGGHYRESGDATPENVTKKVAPHFRRVALTRAKARCLRDALGIDMVACEELGEE